MSLKTVQTSALDDYVSKIKNTINEIANDFFTIGYYLWEIREYKYYLDRGYKDIVEFAEKELNFKKRSTYNFIAIVEHFAEYDNNSYPKMWIDKKYREYGYSQLTEMLSLAPEQREIVKPDMTIKEIREIKKVSTAISSEPAEEKIIDANFEEVKKNDVVNENIRIENKINPDNTNKCCLELDYKMYESIIKDLSLRFHLFYEKYINESHGSIRSLAIKDAIKYYNFLKALGFNEFDKLCIKDEDKSNFI